MRFVIVAVVLLIAACIALAATATRYYVRDKVSGSSVLWSADRCIVVVGVDRYGLHTTLAGSLIESVRARLNVAGSRPDDRSSAVILFTVTSAGVDAKRAPLPYSDFEVMDGSLYSRLGGYQRSLWRWTGATFEKATVDQEAALASARAPIDFEHRNGWSKRFDPFHRGARSEVPIFVGGRSAVRGRSSERAARDFARLPGMREQGGELPDRPLSDLSDLKLDGSETFDLTGISSGLSPRQEATLIIHRKGGATERAQVVVRIDTPIEVEYFRHGGILQYVLRQILGMV